MTKSSGVCRPNMGAFYQLAPDKQSPLPAPKKTIVVRGVEELSRFEAAADESPERT